MKRSKEDMIAELVEVFGEIGMLKPTYVVQHIDRLMNERGIGLVDTKEK